MSNLGLLVLRGVTGGLMAGHGAQKLFGAFDGPGLKGTAGFMEMLGLQPGHIWGTAAAASEFGGGTLTALGFLYPFGPIATISSMAMATGKAHWGKPIWGQSGGAELPVVYIAAAVALILTGPGDVSLDKAFGIKLPTWLSAFALITAGASVGYGLLQPAPTPPAPSADAQDASSEGNDTPAHP